MTYEELYKEAKGLVETSWEVLSDEEIDKLAWRFVKKIEDELMSHGIRPPWAGEPVSLTNKMRTVMGILSRDGVMPERGNKQTLCALRRRGYAKQHEVDGRMIWLPTKAGERRLEEDYYVS